MERDWKLMFHNLLTEALRDALFDSDEAYECWLKTEIGLTDEMIAELKESDLWVKPFLVKAV